jgi:hypothetical protein
LSRPRFLLFILVFIPFASIAQAQDDLIFEGELDTRTAIESYEVELEAGQIVQFTTEADDSLDTILALFDPNGDEVARNDDYGDGFNSQILYAVSESGTYTVEVSRFSETSSGNFTLTIRFGIEDALALSEEATIILETPVSLNAQNLEIKYPIPLNEGDILVVNAVGTTSGIDTTLELRSAGGSLLAQNDDRGDGSLNSEIIYEIPATGSYVIVVSRYSADVDGEALLLIATDPNAEAPFNYTAVEGTLIAEYSGFLDPDNSTQEYTVELAVGDSLYVYTQATSGDLDTVLTLFDPERQTLALNDDRGDDSLNSAFAYTALVDGEYTVRVGRYEGNASSGDFSVYLLEVEAAVVDTINLLAERAVELSGPEEIIETTNFRIHYTRDGTDAVSDEYLNAFAETLEVIFDVQINQMGWAEPPRNDDGLYDAYLTDVVGNSGSLGYARPTRFVGDNPNTPEREQRATRAVLVVDNDFTDMGEDVNALSLMRATTTHEFNHIIQFGYDSEEALDWLYESTASWIETVTVGDEQDATGYVADSFTYPELCFGTQEQDGYLAYGDWTLLQSMADMHGEHFITHIWANAAQYDGIEVMDRALASVDDSLENAVLRWRIQNFALAYDLAPLFGATVWLENTINDTGDWTFTGAGIQELGANYFAVDMNGSYEFGLDGDSGLELWALGVSDSEVQAFLLGRKGSFDTSGYDYVALMVYHADAPTDFEGCQYLDYEIVVEESSESGNVGLEPMFTFPADEFRPLSSAE